MDTEVRRSNHAKEPTIPAWYALYTRPNFEKRVDAQLKEMGLHSYLPLRTELRQWSDRKKRIRVPLFSCYVFVNAKPKERLISLQANGVVRMLSNNGQPSRIPEKEIEAVQQIVSNGFDPKPVYDVVPGDLLEITSGPLIGFQGILREVQGRKRFIVTFEAIGQSVSVNIEPQFVRKAVPLKNGYANKPSTDRVQYNTASVYR